MLKIAKVTRNKDAIISKASAAKLPIINSSDEVEVHDLDTISIHSVRWNTDGGYLQITFRIGYIDNDGKFHSADKYPAHEFAIERGIHPAIWQKYNLDTLESFGRIEEILHNENGVAHAAIVAWGLKGVESIKD
jgi:hypothetical protein